jgi:hypothetical protein
MGRAACIGGRSGVIITCFWVIIFMFSFCILEAGSRDYWHHWVFHQVIRLLPSRDRFNPLSK